MSSVKLRTGPCGCVLRKFVRGGRDSKNLPLWGRAVEKKNAPSRRVLLFVRGGRDSKNLPLWGRAVEKKNAPLRRVLLFVRGGRESKNLPLWGRAVEKKNAPSRRVLLFVRGGRDSNPRLSFNPSTHLAGEPNRPLWHLPRCIPTNPVIYQPPVVQGGGRGIRTPGDLAATTDFKSVALNHSAIPPRGEILP
jgi:hypothetical protein